MKKPLAALISASMALCTSLLILSFGSMPPKGPQLNSRDFVPGELLVKLKEETIGDPGQSKWLIRDIFSQVQGKIKTYLGEEKDTFEWEPNVFNNRSFHADQSLFHIRIPEGIDLDNAISVLKSNPYVEYVERNGIVHILTNDPYFDQQWGLLNAPARHDIHAEEAWAIATGSSEVIVAVLDTGLDYQHEDIQANLWQNPNETLDGQDNDLNGFRDDLHGWDFSSGLPGASDPMDDHTYNLNADYECVLSYPNYHGTHVSGIIGAAGNNSIGISGVCWTVKIMPVKIANSCGQSSNDRVINGLDYATKNGAFLTSNSYGGPGFPYSQAVMSAIGRAQEKNRLYVVSAGNEGTNIDSNPRYPACYTNPNIVTVLATKEDDTRWESSNYGHSAVDIGAPGFEILSTKRGDAYQIMTGTSQAAPHVAGVAALALGLCPGLTYGRLKDLIIDGADYVEDLNNKCVANGRVNAFNVLNGLSGSTAPGAPTSLSVYQIAWNILGLRWNDNSNNELGFEIQRRDQYQSSFLHENCADSNATSLAYCQDSIDTTRSSYTYRVRAVNKAGISAFSNTCEFIIPQIIPDAPSDLDGQSPTLEQNVNIWWVNHAVNALHNYVERRIPGVTSWQVIKILSYIADSYSDGDARAGRTYEYRVRAGNPIGYSAIPIS